MNRLSIKEYIGVEGLISLREKWQKLLEEKHCSRFFHRWEWYKSYLDCLALNMEEAVFLEASIEEKTIAILPLLIREKNKSDVFVKSVGFPAHSHVNLSGAIVASEEQRLVESLIEYLSVQKKIKWDVLQFDKVLNDSILSQQLSRYSGAIVKQNNVATSAYISCDMDSSHLDRMSTKFKRNLRRLHNKALKAGEVSFHYEKGRPALDKAFEHFLEIEASGWKGSDGTGSAIGLDPVLKKFYMSLLEGFATKGDCQINLVKIDGVYAAGQFCLITDGILYLLKIGYKEEFNNFAPGSLLLYDLIQNSLENPYIHTISFVTGPEWVKRWNPLYLDVDNFFLFRNSIAGISNYQYLKAKYVVKKIVK